MTMLQSSMPTSLAPMDLNSSRTNIPTPRRKTIRLHCKISPTNSLSIRTPCASPTLQISRSRQAPAPQMATGVHCSQPSITRSTDIDEGNSSAQQPSPTTQRSSPRSSPSPNQPTNPYKTSQTSKPASSSNPCPARSLAAAPPTAETCLVWTENKT